VEAEEIEEEHAGHTAHRHTAHEHEEHETIEFKLLTKDGKIIYSTEEFEFFQDIYNETIARFGKIEDPKHRDYFIGSGDMPGEGEELFAHVHSKGYKNYKGLGWFLIIEHEVEEVFAPATKLRNILLGVSLGVMMLAVLIGFFISRSISIPITKLRRVAVEIGKGKLDTKVEIKSKDEVGSLAASFNKMAEDLKKSREKIKDYSRVLEKKVDERTEDLRVANEEMEATNEELKQANEELETSAEELRAANEEAQRAKQQAEKRLADLEKFNKASVGRELKMKELKAKIEELEAKLKEKG